MACRLVALDKQPGVRPLGIGEVWRRGMVKCILVCCGEDAKAACGSTNLCACLEACIEGALHAVIGRAALANTPDLATRKSTTTSSRSPQVRGKCKIHFP